jgi:hypothetical protein
MKSYMADLDKEIRYQTSITRMTLPISPMVSILKGLKRLFHSGHTQKSRPRWLPK